MVNATVIKSEPLKISGITRIALLAVGNKEAALLWMMVDRFMAENFVIGVAASADMAILDGDAVDFPDAFASWSADHPNAPCVVLTDAPVQQSPDGRVFYVSKPIHAPDLVSKLNKVGAQIRAAKATQAEANVAAAAVEVASPVVPPVRKPVPLKAVVPPVVSDERTRLQAAGASSSAGPHATAQPAPKEVLSVDICMATDPFEVFDTIGVSTDVLGTIGVGQRPAVPGGSALPSMRASA